MYVTNSGLAGVNEGRCIYYYYGARGGADRGPFSAYVYTKGGGRRAWIKLTELEMGTTYDFTISFHPRVQGRNVGTQVTTKGPRMAVRSVVVDRITLTDARATINVDNETGNSHAVYYRYFKTADTDDSNLHVTGNANTVTDPVVFNLPSLTAGTEYIAEASLEPSFPTNRTKFDIFPTKRNKPTGLGVTPGDGQLELGWTKPAGGDAIDEYIVQWKSGSETFDDAEADGRQETVAHVADTTTYDTTISSLLTNGTEYTVRVKAVNESGEAVSGEETGTPATIPEAPKELTVIPGNEMLTVSWEPLSISENGGADIIDYELQYSDDEGQTWSTFPPAMVVDGAQVYNAFIRSLQNGTTYDIRVRADNGVVLLDDQGNEDEGNYNWATDDGTPRPEPIVTEVTVADATVTQTEATATVTIENETDDGQTVHLQYRKTTESGWKTETPKTVVATATSETFNLRNLSGNTNYVVEAWLTTTSSIKESATFKTGPVEPDPPTNLKVTRTEDEEITVAWDAPADGGSEITGYKIQWKLYSQNNWNTYTQRDDDDGRSPYTINVNLENGEKYDIRVIAVNEVGDSGPSGEVTGAPSKKPDPPTDVEVSAHGDKWLEVTWTEPEDKGGLPTTYIVQWKSGADYSETDKADPATSPHKITNLKNGTQYTVRVLAKNVRGTSDDPGDGSNEDTGTPMTKPQKPTDVSARFGDKSLTVSWTAPTGIEGTGGSPITGFKIQWKLNSEADWDTNTYTEIDDDDGQSPYTIEEVLTNGTMYDVRVLAVNDNDNVDDNTSDPSDAATGTPSRKPHKPTGVDITDHGDGWLEVTWTALTGDATGGSPIKNYIVQWKSGANYDTTNQGTPTVSPYKITNLENGTPYTVRVLGVNEANPDTSGDPSDEVTETPRTIPGPPTELGVISGDKELTVSWTAPVPEKNGGAGINQFVVQWKSGDQDYDTSRQETTSNTSQVIKPLTNGTPYSIQVRADNGEEPEGEQEYNWEETTGTPMTVPGAPTNLEVEEGDRQLKVSWVAPTNTGGLNIKIDHFVIQWQVKGGNWSSPDEHTTTDGNKLTDTITGLDNGTDYDIRVRADNDVEGQTFEWAYTTGKPRKIPSAPRSLRVEAGDGQIALSWAAPSDKGGLDINQYIVQWKSGIQEYDTSRQATPTITSQVIGDLTNGTLYSFRVRADNSVEANVYNWVQGTGTPSAAPSPPPPPNNPPPQRSPVNPTPPVIKSPEVSSVIFADILQTSANATVKIMYAGTSQKTVRLHYRVDGATAWSTPPKSDKTSGSSKTFTLSDLTAGTTYEVQAWLDSSLPPAGTKIYEFDTLDEQAAAPDPIISNLKCENIGQTSATAMVEIANAGTGMNEVFLKHSIQGEDEWTMLPFPTITYDDDTSIPLTGLTEGTTYEVAVALSNDFSGMVIEQCTTLAAPSLSGVSVGSITQTSAIATVSIADAGTAQKTVLLQYREFGENEWISKDPHDPHDTEGASTSFNLTSLEPRTTYEVKAYLSNDPDAPKYAVFTTLAPGPSVSSISVGSITQTSAVATVNIAYAGNSQLTVHLHYRKFGESEWISTDPKTTEGASTSFDLTGLTPKTKYEVEASLSSDFAGAEAVTFTTLAPEPSVSSTEST